MRPRSRGMVSPEVFQLRWPSSNQRAQGKPGADCTRGLVCQTHSNRRTRAYRFSRNSPAFPTQWLYGLLRALPGERAFLPPSPAGHFPPTWRQHRSARTTRLRRTPWRFRPALKTPDAKASITSRAPRVVTIMIRPSCGRETGAVIILISRIVKRNIFHSGA